MYLEAKRRRGDECRLNIHIYFDYRNSVSDLATVVEVKIQLRISIKIKNHSQEQTRVDFA